MKLFFLCLFVLFILTGTSANIFTEYKPSNRLFLHSETIQDNSVNARHTYATKMSSLTQELLQYTGTGSVVASWLLRVKGPILKNTRQELQKYLSGNARVIDYIPDNTFIIISSCHTEDLCDQIKKFVLHYKGAMEIIDMQASYKMTATFASNIFESLTDDNDDVETVQIRVIIWEHAPVSTTSLVDKWQATWTTLNSRSSSNKLNIMSNDESLCPLLAPPEIASDNILLTLPRKNAALCTSWLSYQNEVAFLENKPKYKLLNEYAKLITQDASNMNSTILYDGGLSGEGEVVIVADTGLDHDNCFFYDKIRGAAPNGRSTDIQPDMEQRKVVMYINDHGDSGDDVRGHGTHVAGSIAASIDHDDDGDRKSVV